ncbi:MAG: alanine racemase [Clostridia bacterium]|nr:alanine racemase [Clostridia bacterium]
MRYRGTYVLVDLEAIKNNMRKIRSFLPEKVQLLAVVKANGYGHGAVPVAKACMEAGADMLGVAIPEEGEELRRHGVDAPVLVLGPVNEQNALADVKYHLTQTVYDAEGVQMMEAACCLLNENAHVHLKIDTGMGRIGVRTEEEMQDVLAALEKAPHVHLTGVFTHFANADGESDDYSHMQMERFERLCAMLPGGIVRHASASAALLKYEDARFDMVRAGLVIYGCPPCKEMPFQVEPALSWLTEVSFVKWIESGECVSYGCTFRAERKTQVATLAVGYGDGYHRALSGKGEVLIRGVRCPIIGRVCMDQMMVDATEVPDVQIGDQAVLIGKQGNEEITADELGEKCGTISYEMLLAHAGRVPVEYAKEG